MYSEPTLTITKDVQLRAIIKVFYLYTVQGIVLKKGCKLCIHVLICILLPIHVYLKIQMLFF